MISLDRQRKFALACVYLALYVMFAWLSHARPMLAPGITPWHPQAGLTLAFLLMCGPQWFGVTAFGALLVGLLYQSTPESPAAIVAGAVWIAFIYAVLAHLLRRVLSANVMRTTADAARFAGLTAAMTLIAAAGFVGVFVAVSDVPAADALRGTARYWLADLNGMLMLTPLLLLFEERRRAGDGLRGRRWEIFSQSAVLLLLPAAILLLPVDEQLRFFYLLFLPVIWIALRWNWIGALPAVLVVQATLIFAAEADIHTPRFIDLQFLMLTLSLTALLLGSVVAERRRTEVELREREAALSRAMRFAVAGELASSLAHELNQPITALVSYLNASEILAVAPPVVSDARLPVTLRKATQEAIRASDVLHRLRNLYIGGRSRRDLVNIGKLCNAVASAFADRLRAASTRLELSLAESLPDIQADETQLEIVLHNLMANAIDAAASGSGRERSIEMRATTDRNAIVITVEDSGPGVSPQLIAQLFEPFVTSKSDGMGLGLAISRSLVRAHGGEIICQPGARLGGARFSVTLPLKPPPTEAE
jgi:two-component system, LuxR family, sensor kinase FixL